MNAENSIDSSTQEKLSRRSRLQEELRVLAVDDDHNILQLLKTALSAFHFNITIADSGANALKMIEKADKPFDCFLLDIQMPAMNGIMLCKEIRKIAEYKQSPILMLTAMSDREYVDLAFVAGATDYVTKPFDFLELRSRMSAAQRLVQERRIAEANGARKSTGVKRQKFPLDEAIAIEGIERVLRNTEFDNYIMQLSQGRLFNTHAVAVKLADAARMHKRLTPENFEGLLHDIASSMTGLTKKTGDIVSYRGDGVFLMVRHGRFGTDQAELEMARGTARGSHARTAGCPASAAERPDRDRRTGNGTQEGLPERPARPVPRRALAAQRIVLSDSHRASFSKKTHARRPKCRRPLIFSNNHAPRFFYPAPELSLFAPKANNFEE